MAKPLPRTRYCTRRRARQGILLAEAIAWLILGPALLRLFPFQRLLPPLCRAETEGEWIVTQRQQQMAIEVGHALVHGNRALPWRSSCLVLAFAGAMMLRRRDVPYILYLGARMGDERLAAHAWLRSGPVMVAGGDGERDYAVVGTFAG